MPDIQEQEVLQDEKIIEVDPRIFEDDTKGYVRRDATISGYIQDLKEYGDQAWKGNWLFGDKGQGSNFLHDIGIIAGQNAPGINVENREAFVPEYLKESAKIFNEQSKKEFGDKYIISPEVINETIEGNYDPYAEEVRGMFAEGGPIEDPMSMDEQMGDLMPTEENMLPDEQMEEDFVDYVISSSLSTDDEQYLLTRLEEDPRLSIIIDSVVETASEFSGSGPVVGPGTEMSDSIPARLSDGEFVMTAKAANEIGPDNLQGMMEQAEAVADERQMMQMGGVVEKTEGAQDAEIVQGASKGKVQPGMLLPRTEQDRELQNAMMLRNPRFSLFAR